MMQLGHSVKHLVEIGAPKASPKPLRRRRIKWHAGFAEDD
jgi:hypothetical protein